MSSDAREFMAHLAIALSTHEKAARRSSLAVPAELLALRDIALSLATERQGATPLDVRSSPADDEDMASKELMLTRRDAANLLRVSVRTVDRLVGAGSLRSVLVGGSRRIRRSDLDDYVQALTPPPQRLRDGITTKESA